MIRYTLTVFEKTGEKLLDETIEAENDKEAKKQAEKLLKGKGYSEKIHRFVTSDGKLLLFQG